MGGAGGAARVVAIRSMTVGGQPYWAAADIAAYLDSAADNWAAVGEADDVVPQSIAYRLSQLSVQLTAEAILQHDWWAGHRFGRPSPPAPGSSLPGGAKVCGAIKYELGERHLYFSAASVAGFLHVEADRCLREHERLFDRESAARMAARYLHATADDLDLESMLVTRGPSGREPMPGQAGDAP